MMDVKQIVTEWLKEHGYDGLYFESDCGCLLDDLMCCEECFDTCMPGYKMVIEGEEGIGPTRDAAGRGE
jgi:hypothetical protein